MAPSDSPASTLGGAVAVELAHELAEPIRALRDRLGLVVDRLERHVATSTGPTPYPWKSLQALRQELAATYLEATQLARRLDDLDRALRDEPAAWFDPTTAVELGLQLAERHLGDGLELLCDLARIPPARGVPGTLAIIVAQLVAECARSGRAAVGSSLSVRLGSEPGWAIVAIADNGGGSDRAIELGAAIRSIVATWGGTIDATTAAGQGCAFELRLAAQRPAV